MRQVEINRLEMLEDTNDYLDIHATVWNPIPIITRYKNDLTQVIQAIKQAARDQDASQVFIGRSKKQLKREIAEKLDILDDTAEAYAGDIGDAELLSKVSNSMSDYYQLPDEDFETKSKNVIDLLQAHVADMADYGMSQEQLDDIKLQFNQFEEKSGKPRAFQIASRIATESLDDLFKESTVISSKLDKVMNRFKRSHASFHKGYVAARSIVNSWLRAIINRINHKQKVLIWTEWHRI